MVIISYFYFVGFFIVALFGRVIIGAANIKIMWGIFFLYK